MKNKIIICLLSLIVCLNIIKPYALSADALAMDPSSIAALGDLGMGLLGGASFDFSSSKYKVPDASSDDAYNQAREKAMEFLNDYSIVRGIPYQGYNPAVISSPRDYFNTFYFNSNATRAWRAYRQAQNDADRDAALVFELSHPAYAAWTAYDINWYNKYISDFSHVTETTPSLPADYSYLQNSNILSVQGMDFISTFDSYPMMRYQNGNYVVGQSDWGAINPRDCTLYNPSGTFTHNVNANGRFYSFAIYNGILTCNFNTSNFSMTYSGNGFATSVAGQSGNTFNELQFNSFETGWPPVITSGWNASNSGYASYSFEDAFVSIPSAMEYLYSHFCNFNLYVDGQPWVVMSAPANPVIPDFNDIIDKDTEEPAYDIIMPDTTTGTGYFDLTSILDRLTQAILGASDLDDSTSSVVDKDAVKVLDDAKEEVTTKEVPADEVIDDSVDDYNKKLPIVPLPPGIVDAFQGTSILAELIDGVQTVLPEDLITVFWGIVSVIFIIGIIRVMHK